MKLADRMNRILIETAFEVLVKARNLEAQGKSILHLEIGEPDFASPKGVIAAAKEALDQGWTHYGPTQGYPRTSGSAPRVARSRRALYSAETKVEARVGQPWRGSSW